MREAGKLGPERKEVGEGGWATTPGIQRIVKHPEEKKRVAGVAVGCVFTRCGKKGKGLGTVVGHTPGVL
jgi:hypothetical protein